MTHLSPPVLFVTTMTSFLLYVGSIAVKNLMGFGPVYSGTVAPVAVVAAVYITSATVSHWVWEESLPLTWRRLGQSVGSLLIMLMIQGVSRNVQFYEL